MRRSASFRWLDLKYETRRTQTNARTATMAIRPARPAPACFPLAAGGVGAAVGRPPLRACHASKRSKTGFGSLAATGYSFFIIAW